MTGRKFGQHLAESRLPALKRLIAYTPAWLIEYHPDGAYWSAEKRTGSRVRYLCGATTDELADMLDNAEAGQ